MITAEDYKNPYGIWKVTTEGDCEGRSTRQLGIFQGYIDDIAFALAEKCCYSLQFTKISIDIPTPTKAIGEVNVTLDIGSETWKLTPEQRVDFFRTMLYKREVFVSKSSEYASVTLCNPRIENAKREIALAKLTHEEKSLLGLE